jgi:glycosyltransferase involved in cell wall biosynthesis
MAIALRLDRELAKYGPTDVIIQYTNQMWDAWRFGSPAIVWLASRVRRRGARVTVLVHEPFVPWSRRPDLAAAAALQRAQFAAVMSRADRVFVTTGTRARMVAPLCRLVGAPEPRVIRIGPSAIPIDANNADRGTGLRLGYFSTAGVGKRFDVALDAFRTVAERHPSAELVLIGDLGPPDRPQVAEITRLVEQHPARARIRLTGKLSLQEIAREVAALDIYLFPMNTGANSRSCTLPLALGSGLPVVAIQGQETDPELFRDGENVAFARELTGAAFAAVALQLAEDRNARDRIGAGAKRLYEMEMSWPRIGDALLEGEAAAA